MFSTLASPTQVTVLGSWAMTAPLMGEGGCQWKCTGNSILPNQGWDPASLVCKRMELRLTLASCLEHLQLLLFQWLGAECCRREHNKVHRSLQQDNLVHSTQTSRQSPHRRGHPRVSLLGPGLSLSPICSIESGRCQCLQPAPTCRFMLNTEVP